MSKIKKHPVLEVPVRDKVIFKYNGQEVEGEKGYTIAAALHRAGFPVHSHSPVSYTHLTLPTTERV